MPLLSVPTVTAESKGNGVEGATGCWAAAGDAKITANEIAPRARSIRLLALSFIMSIVQRLAPLLDVTPPRSRSTLRWRPEIFCHNARASSGPRHARRQTRSSNGGVSPPTQPESDQRIQYMEVPVPLWRSKYAAL